MDIILPHNLQDNGHERDQAIEDCLRNPLIVRIILEYISSKELLQFSLVNKLWKSEARSVLSNRGYLIANLGSNPCYMDRCEAVPAFVSDLLELPAAPYTGIHFGNYYERHCCSFPLGALSPIHDVSLLDQLSLKSVSVEITGPWLEFPDCPALFLIKKVLKQFCGVLEELELDIQDAEEDFIKKFVQNCNFPRLNILKVNFSPKYEFNDDEHYIYENYMKALLSRTPNLKMLHTNWYLSSTLKLLQGTSIVLQSASPLHAPFDWISENVISTIRLEEMKLEYTGRGFNFEGFNRIAPKLLEASCTTTLRSMKMDAVLAVALMCYGVPLKNVKYLDMDIDYRHLELSEPRILRIVKNFDFTRTFPNLSKVTIVSKSSVHDFSPEHMNALIEQANAVLREPSLDRAARIKKLLVFNRYTTSSAPAQFFVEMFPNIEKLEVIGSLRSIPFGLIGSWSNLRKLNIQGDLQPFNGNLDSILCGIFPEEVAELRLMDNDYLERVNIIPVVPAVTCLRNLRSIALVHEHDEYEPIDEDENLFFLKVTALLAFVKQPTLAVSLKVSSSTEPPPMTHLEPFMSVTYDVDENEDYDE